jgi:hypothetical protein
MKKIVLCLSTTALALVLGVPTDTLTHRNSLRRVDCQLVPLPPSARHHSLAPHIRISEGTSLNWSGYAAVAGSLASPQVGAATQVVGKWTVPEVTGSTAYSSVWVGLDGYADGTVEQLGTEQDTEQRGHKFSTTYYAWFEMYPAGGFEIANFPTAPGDSIGAGVTYAGNNVFTLAITNFSRGIYYVVPASYTTTANAARSSAEWVVEAPSSRSGVLPLADFGTVNLTDCSAVINGIYGPISLFVNDPLTMATSNGTPKAVPTGLSADPDSDGSSVFEVTWHHD